MAAKAKIVEKRGQKNPNGQRTRIMRLMAGENGDGPQLGPAVEYWPWSDRSCEAADQTIFEIAKTNGVEVVQEW
jgi:hypothetical protein